MWVKTTVYEYICANYGVHPEPGTTIMADTPVSEEEYAFPKLEGLPDDTPLGKLKKDEVWFPGLEYLLLNDPPKMVYRSTENHESVYVRYSESGNLYEEKYLSKEYSYSSMDGEVYGLASDLLSFTSEHTFYTYYDGEYIRSLLISPDGLSDDKYHMLKDAGFALEEGTLQETIQSVKKKDGRIIVTSFESPEAIEASEMGGLVSYNAEYVLDAKTHELISVKDVIEYDDGTVYNVGVDFIYDAEIPEGMKAFVEYEQQTEDLRTITIVSNPGTESEKSESVQIPKGLSVALEPDFIFELDFSTNPEIEEVFELYSDAACTQLFDLSEDDDSDITIYVKWCQ